MPRIHGAPTTAKTNTNTDAGPVASKRETSTAKKTGSGKAKATSATNAPAAHFAGTVATSDKPAPLANNALTAGGATVLKAHLAALSKDPVKLAATQKLLGKVLTDLSSETLTPKVQAKLERQLIDTLVKLSAAGKLEETIRPIALLALAKLQPHASADEKEVMVKQFSKMIEIQLGAHGLTPATAGTSYVSWEELGKQQLALARSEVSGIHQPEFKAQLEKLLGQKFVPGDVELLVNGPASFALRDQLIDNAKESITYMTWAFYNDATGDGALEKLKAAQARGVDVRVLVDDEVANEPAHAAFLKKLTDAGIPAMRVPGHHRKVLVVDGKTAITGGLNVGDVYSHRGKAADDPKQQWRDTDIAIRGEAAVSQAFGVIKSVWDAQAALHDPPLDPLPLPSFSGAASSGAQIAVVDDQAGSADRDPIFVGLLKAIESCQGPADGPIDIENAYFILNPALRESLAKARERGVPVRILSNSPDSVDVPMIATPILTSLKEMADLGCDVYLKQGSTLHTKMAAVGRNFSTIGSYNLHPQSIKFKGETNAFVLDDKFTTAMRGQFEKDIADAVKLDPATLAPIKKDPATVLVERFFFDFL